MMILSQIREVAEGRGIQNANQLKDALAISPTLAARLWRGDFTQIGMVTLDRLCRELKCQPGQLILYAPSQRKR
jgi:DNA-binding Xre family transcriptional regulator